MGEAATPALSDAEAPLLPSGAGIRHIQWQEVRLSHRKPTGTAGKDRLTFMLYIKETTEGGLSLNVRKAYCPDKDFLGRSLLQSRLQIRSCQQTIKQNPVKTVSQLKWSGKLWYPERAGPN